MRSEGSRSVERMTGDGRYAEPERRFVSPRRDRRRVDLPEPTDEKAHQKLAPQYRDGDELTRTEDNAQLAIRESEIDIAQPEDRSVLAGLTLVCPSEGRVDKTNLGLARSRRLCEDCVLLRLLLVEVVVDSTQRDVRLQDMDKHCGTERKTLSELFDMLQREQTVTYCRRWSRGAHGESEGEPAQ